MDRRDEPLAAGVWHVEGTADYGDIFRGTGAEFATWVTEVHAGFERHSHQITNVLVEVGSTGDEAVSEAYVTVVLWTAPDADGGVTQISSRGRYLDKWERRGRWGSRPPPLSRGLHHRADSSPRPRWPRRVRSRAATTTTRPTSFSRNCANSTNALH